MKMTRPLMGTFFTVIIEDEDASPGKIEAAFSEAERIEKMFSRFLENSELSELNRSGLLTGASDDFIYLIKKALFYSEISSGRYTPAILPLIEFYSQASHYHKNEKVIRELISLADYRNIILDVERKEVRLSRPGVKVDLSSIAKGYAIDKAIEALRKCGVRSGLVDGGGDIKAINGKKGENYWRIGLRDPFSRGIKYVIKICDMAIATSGTYERFLGINARVPHIIDGKTGRPVTEVASSTVISKDAVDADALATMVVVMGSEALDIITKNKLGEALIIYRDKKTEMTDGFSDFILESL